MAEAGGAPAVLVLDGVRIRARGEILVDGFDFRLASGEAAALVGPSGCGKSLLLRVAAGLERPDAGERRVAASRAAFVFREGGLVRNVTVAENLRLPLYYRGLGDAAARDAAASALEMFGVAGAAEERPSELLNETRILVQFARAAALETDLLFLDEPFPQLSRTAAARVERWLGDEVEKGGLAVMMTGVEPQSVPQIPTRVVDLAELGGALSPAVSPNGAES